MRSESTQHKMNCREGQTWSHLITQEFVCACRLSRFYVQYGGLKIMLAPNGKDLANNNIDAERRSSQSYMYDW